MIPIEKAAEIAVNNIITEGLTDIFPRPFELDLLKNKHFKKNIVEETIRSLKGGSLESLGVSSISAVLNPKKGVFDFRKCSLISPLDTIKYLALVLLIADDIENARIKSSSKVIFSYRFKIGKGYIFSRKYKITSFLNYSASMSKKQNVNVVAKCDIANYYDRLNLHRLECVLMSLTKDKKTVKLINEVLLFWADRNSYGLPVGSNASRILAEAALIEVDNYLYSQQVKFSRFVDDYRFFAPSARTAHYWVSMLIDRLSMEGLCLNSAKTHIEDVSGVRRTTESSRTKPDNNDRKRFVHGYDGLVPLKFRNLSEKEIEKYVSSEVNVSEINIEAKVVIKEKEFTDYCKTILARKEWDKFTRLPLLLDKFPQFYPYVIDMILKHANDIPIEICAQIASKFAEKLLSDEKLPEYIAVCLVLILGKKEFENRESLMSFFRSMKRTDGAYIGRAAIESLFDCASRGDVLEIRNYYSRADQWEKRAIIKLVNTVLDEDEKRPWLKVVKVNSRDDIFALGLFETALLTKKKRKKKK